MPTAWGNEATCHDLSPACPSRDRSKGPVTSLELLIPPLCKGTRELGLQCVPRHWLSGRTGFGGTWRRSPIWWTLASQRHPVLEEGELEGLLLHHHQSWVLIPGRSAQGKERADIKLEAEKRVYFCSKSKAYCLGDKMWTVLLWSDCVDECVCISTLPCFTLSHTAGGGSWRKMGPGNIVQMQIWVDL